MIRVVLLPGTIGITSLSHIYHESKRFHASFNTIKVFSPSTVLFLYPLSVDLNLRKRIPLAGNKIVLSFFKMSTCAWWSQRIIYFSHRDTKGCTDESKSFSLSLSFFFVLKREHFVLFPFAYCALYLIFRIPMHRFTCELIFLVELF